jgi:methionine-rich copper-binding protein CopC
VLRLAVATGIALAGILVFAVGAFAHSRPVRFDPAPGAVLQAAPSKVDGWFTAAIRRDPNWSFIKVTDSQGNHVETGDVTLSSDRLAMSVSLKPGLTAGRYLVTWRTWDDGDGAIFGDCFAFFVGQAAADQATSAKTRLDGGGSCERIDVSAKNGTPVPGSTPATTSADSGDEDMPSSADSGGSKVPWWTLVVGIGGGLLVGAIGGRLAKQGFIVK